MRRQRVAPEGESVHPETEVPNHWPPSVGAAILACWTITAHYVTAREPTCISGRFPTARSSVLRPRVVSIAVPAERPASCSVLSVSRISPDGFSTYLPCICAGKTEYSFHLRLCWSRYWD